MKQLQRYARLALFDLPWMAAVTGGLFAIGVGMTLLFCLAFLSWSDGYGMMGGTLGLLGILLAVLIRHNLNPHTRLFLALTMGESRRSYLFFDTLMAVLECLILCALEWVLCHLEIALYSLVLPRYSNELNILELFYRPAVVGIFVAAIVTLNLFWTALMGRFGPKGFFLSWFPLWMLAVLTAPAIDAAQSGEKSLFGLLGRGIMWVIDAGSFLPWQAVAGAALLAVLAVSAALLRRIPVRL